MRPCPGCGYLVPEAWENCKRCDTALENVDAALPPREPVYVGAAERDPRGSEAVGSVDRQAPPRARSAPAPVGPMARPAPPPIPVGAPATGPAASAPIRVGNAAATDSLDDPPRSNAVGRRRRSSTTVAVAWFLVVVVVAAGAWFARDLLVADPLPPEVAAYTAGKLGVAYASEAGRYLVVLPNPPQESSTPVGDAQGALAVHQAISRTDELEIAVSYVDLPVVVPDEPLTSLRAAAAGAALEFKGEVTEERRTDHQGHPALDVRFEAGDGQGRVRTVLVGHRMYSVLLMSELDESPGFERLVGSFDIQS